MFNLVRKTLWDKRFFILGWSLGILFLSYLMTIFYPTFNDGVIDELAASLPPALQGLVGDLDALKVLSTYLGAQLFDIRLPIFVSILAILLGLSLTVSEEDKGELRTLVGLPVSRTTVVFAKWIAIVVICLIASVAIALGVDIGVLQIQESLDQAVLIDLVLATWLLMVAMATIIFGIGIATGSRALTMTAGIVLAVGSFIVTTFAMSVEWLQDYEWLSILHYFPAAEIAKDGLSWENMLVYLVLIVVSLAAAVIFFRRRDVKSA